MRTRSLCVMVLLALVATPLHAGERETKTRLAARAADHARKPNFIVILIDDMGYRDVGVYGAKDIRTPHIDSLARNGTRFVNGYSTSAVCSPARAALLTGRYQEATGLNGSYRLIGPQAHAVGALMSMKKPSATFFVKKAMRPRP